MTPHFPPAVALEHSRVGQILAQCGEVAATIHTERDPAKYYVFIDDLDRIGGTSRRHNDAVIRAITDFIDAVASAPTGECLAIRIFLSDDLYEPLKRALGHLWGEPILLVRLTWTVDRCMEVVERRLEKAWQDTPRPNDQRHLPLLLDQDAIGMFGRQLETSQKQGHLEPRLAVRALSTAVDTVVQDEELRERIGAGRISGDVYASSQELLLRPHRRQRRDF